MSGGPHPNLAPSMFVKNFDKAFEFYEKVFSAKIHNDVIYRNEEKKVMHSELILENGARLYVMDHHCFDSPAPPYAEDSPGPIPPFHLNNVKNPDELWKTLVANGATVVIDYKQQFWGDIYGQVRDPFGFQWSLSKAGPKKTSNDGEESDAKKRKVDEKEESS
eukprot:m.265148 g.265148  ORF g.265148 m.265148 type:complete len:163 (+) comp28640_c0_seq1:152-640(+)